MKHCERRGDLSKTAREKRFSDERESRKSFKAGIKIISNLLGKHLNPLYETESSTVSAFN
jgi:hypothetical protein